MCRRPSHATTDAPGMVWLILAIAYILLVLPGICKACRVAILLKLNKPKSWDIVTVSAVLGVISCVLNICRCAVSVSASFCSFAENASDVDRATHLIVDDVVTFFTMNTLLCFGMSISRVMHLSFRVVVVHSTTGYHRAQLPASVFLSCTITVTTALLFWFEMFRLGWITRTLFWCMVCVLYAGIYHRSTMLRKRSSNNNIMSAHFKALRSIHRSSLLAACGSFVCSVLCFIMSVFVHHPSQYVDLLVASCSMFVLGCVIRQTAERLAAKHDRKRSSHRSSSGDATE